MKIEIVVTDKKKGEVRIPITKAEASAMYDVGFMIEADYDTLELNKVDKPFFKLHEKFLHLVNDVVYDGVCFTMEGDKFKKLDKKWWLVRKPKWKKTKK